MESEISSLPRSKPSSCPTEAWNDLSEIIQSLDDEPDETNEVILEITDVDQNGELTVVSTQKTNILRLSSESPRQERTILVIENIIDENNKTTAIPENAEQENVPNPEIVANVDQETNDAKKKLTRKRLKNPPDWKQNIRKYKRQKGEEYLDTNGNKKPARAVQTKTCRRDNCVFKCSQVITKEERHHIHSQFWKLDDGGKVHFYSKHIKRITPLRKRTKKDQSKKHYTYGYYFEVSGVKIRVCQEYFINTLNISKQRIYYYFKKNLDEAVPNSPTQGKHRKKVIPEEKKDQVRQHIRSFPSIESHYCRANTKKTYLERGINKRKMYDLYRESTDNPVKFHLYSQIFDTEFNISFFKPKKDLCDKCEQFKVQKDPSPKEIILQESHLRRKDIGKLEKDRDRTKYVGNEEIGVITFDLENVISLPKANISNFFYKTKLACYNLTAYLDKSKTVYNAIWNKFLAGRAGIHIACAVLRILKQVMIDNPNIKKIILWSDSCIAQNKNSIMSYAIQHFLSSACSKNLTCIEQKFSEPGHGNVQEIDCAHSCIERHIKNLELWSPISLLKSLKSIPSTWKFKFKVLEMKESDYFDFQKISKTLSYSKIPYTKVKQIIYKKTDLNTIDYKETFKGETKTIKITLLKSERSVKGKPTDKILFHDFSEKVPVADKQINISNLKREHLAQMKMYIPNDIEKIFYDNLLSIKNTPGKNNNKEKKSLQSSKKKRKQ